MLLGDIPNWPAILNAYGPRAAELLEAGWYFEEGGCFGMALAIGDAVRRTTGERVQYAAKTTTGVHAIAVVRGRGLDWQGTVEDLRDYKIMSHRTLIALAHRYGSDSAGLAADRDWAAKVLNLARELADED